MSGSNVVPMNWSSTMPAGCCPPSNLMQCYCDVQNATAFISKVVTDLAANDPAFQQALADAVAASGSALPLIGVTDGSPGQPGQVGEFWQAGQNISYLGTGSNETFIISLGVVPPGDWDIWLFVVPSTTVSTVSVAPNPVPPGLTNTIWAGFGVTAGFGVPAGEGVGALPGPMARGLWSVPTLFAMQAIVSASVPGTLGVTLSARRRR